MAIFGSTYLTGYDMGSYDSVSPTEEGSEQILYEGSRDLYKIIAASYVSDIMIESSVLEGSADPEVLAEGTIKDMVKKIINKFKEILNKIIAWFKKVIENIMVLFMSGEKFAKKYETQLIEKAKKLKSDDVVYEGYEYIEASKIGATASAWVDKFNSVIGGIKAGDTAEDVIETAYKAIDSDYTNVSEVKEGFVKFVHKGETSKTTVKGANNNVSEMINVCKKHKTLIDNMKELESKITKRINAYIKDLGTVNDSESDAAKIISTKTSVYNSAIALNQGLNQTAISLIKEMYRTYTAVLKKIWSFKVSKESWGGSDDGSSLLESALNQL